MLYFKRISKARIYLSVAIAVIVCAAGVAMATTGFSQAADPSDGIAIVAANPNGLPVVDIPADLSVHPITQAKVLRPDAAPNADALVAADEGIVTTAGFLEGYGLTVVIDHGDGLTTLYAYCSELVVELGEVVDAGQVIARVSRTNQSTEPHLYFEVWQDGVRVMWRTIKYVTD